MYFKFERKSSILRVDDDYAHLRRVHKNGDLEFILYYSVSPSAAINVEALTVAVTVFSRNIAKKRVMSDSQRGFTDTRGLVNNILTQVQDAKSTAKQQEQFTVASKNSDITTKINNEILPQLKAKVSPNNITQLNKSVVKLVKASSVKEGADIKPLLTRSFHAFTKDTYAVFSGSIDDDPTRLMSDMVIRQGIDPSHVTSMTHRSSAASDTVRGTLRPTRAREVEHSPSTRLLNIHLFPQHTHIGKQDTRQLSDNTYVQVLVSEPTANVEIPVIVIVPRYAREQEGKTQSQFFAKFDLVSSRSGAAIDSVTRTLDVSKHLQVFNTPRKPPVVKATRSDLASRINLEIKQVDPGASAVQVFKKIIHSSLTDVEDYVLVGTYDVKSDQQSLLVQVDLPKMSTAIYRVVPVGTVGAQGFEYTNVVINPTRQQQIKSISLVALQIDTGIQLEVRKIPIHVVAVEMLVRNLTVFERNFRNVGSTITFIDDATRAADFFSIVDRNVKPNNAYEYATRLIYDNGTSQQSGNAVYEFASPSPGKVDTKITNVSVELVDELNVSFTIATTIVDTNIDIVKALLQRQDIYDAFKDDVIREREFLKSLIAHNVQRVDLTTGKREDFGVVTTESFNDQELRKNQAITPLVGGHKYRYEVTALVRSPETMFESLSKPKVDDVTKKSYAFSPAKFLHPITLSRGVLVSTQGLKSRFSKDAMAHGAIGASETVEVSFDVEPASVTDASAGRFDKFMNVVTWKLTGAIDQVDHFLIMKEVNNVRTIIGKAHSEFTHGSCQFIHQLSRRDEGAISYVITPCFNDYVLGSSAQTNVVLVDRFENDVAKAARK